MVVFLMTPIATGTQTCKREACSISPAIVSELMTTRIGSFLLKESSDAMVTTTPEGKMTYWSKGVETAFGYTRADAVGRFVEGTIVPQDHRAEQPGAGSAACRCKFSARWRVFFPSGFPQLTQSGHRLVRAPPFATAGFYRTHLPTSVLPANHHLVFS